MKYSDYLAKLADENGLRMSELELLAVFDQVPMHLAHSIRWTGRNLEFYFDTVPAKKKKKWVRLICGKSKKEGKFIYAFAPVD